ncbi:MAG TPA: cytochrome c [Longimicrobiales bacterium]|nr:cytochrome c [Longimicrobiales bacterium]
MGLAACASAPPEPAGARGGPGAPAAGAPAAGAPVAATYTTEQADRGGQVFGTVCSACHGRREFTGPIFELTWMAEPVGALFQHISTAMPRDDPGSLTAEEYAAVVAYMLRLNGRPPGERELPADAEALARMRW